MRDPSAFSWLGMCLRKLRKARWRKGLRCENDDRTVLVCAMLFRTTATFRVNLGDAGTRSGERRLI
jgi:hypothetical protein